MMKRWLGWLDGLRWSRLNLRRRLLLIMSTIIFVILLGQTLASLSGEVAALDHRIATDGTVLAQTVASAAGPLMDAGNPNRFEPLIERVSETVDLVGISIIDADGRIIGSSDPEQIGTTRDEEPFGAFERPRTSLGLRGLMSGYNLYRVSAPILQGTHVLGFVALEFRSEEISQRIGKVMASAVGMGLLWLGLGAFIGSFYVRRITEPLATLTQAARTLSEGRFDDVELEEPGIEDEVGVLQRSFVRLLEALRIERGRSDALMSELQQGNVRLRERVELVTADLRETTAYLQSVIRCMEEGVITCNQEGEIVQANEGAFRQLRGLGAPAPGANLRNVIPDGEPLDQALRKAIEERAASQLELVRVCEQTPAEGAEVVDAEVGGGERSIVFRVYPLQGLDRTPLGVVVTVIDETDKRRVEMQLRRHDRLISLGTIAAGLAHELGNYMHTIHGFSSILMRSMREDDPLKADVRQIHDENSRAVALLDRFLQFARPGLVHYRPEPIDSLVREAMDMGAYKLRKTDVKVTDALATGDQLVRCDTRLLTQVFVNLVLNAMDAMEGRDVRVLEVGSTLLDDERVRIWFRDTGAGIAKEHRDRIFDPFFTTKAVTGTGLGLSIAHQIVDRHGGTITVDSEVGQGTTFTIELPIAGPKGVGG